MLDLAKTKGDMPYGTSPRYVYLVMAHYVFFDLPLFPIPYELPRMRSLWVSCSDCLAQRLSLPLASASSLVRIISGEFFTRSLWASCSDCLAQRFSLAFCRPAILRSAGVSCGGASPDFISCSGIGPVYRLLVGSATTGSCNSSHSGIRRIGGMRVGSCTS